jgi:AcrR family transcriptional regulator
MPNMKDTIRAVAVDLFHEKGYYATSISEIAKGCGIQKASIYYHYPSKEDLLFQIMQTTMDDLMVHLHASLNGADTIEAKLRAAVRGHVQFHLNRQKENFIANSELRGLTPEHFKAIVEKRDAYERIFLDLIRQGREAGVFFDGDDRILSYAILTLCTSGAFWFKKGGRLTVDEIAEIYEAFVLRGMKEE